MIFLDSAATTLQKPETVGAAMVFAASHMTSPGRGGHRPAILGADTAFACREAAAKLFHVSEPDSVIFTASATQGLNIAIHSLVQTGATVLVSGYEHNAVTRTLFGIAGVTIKVARAPLFQPQEMLAEFARLLTPEVSCVILNHVSNVFGYVLPAQELANLCKARGVPLILDASQSAGALDVHMDTLGAAFIAMPGHKGLYGPQGTGLLLCNHPAQPLFYGGTGSASLQQNMPEFYPDRLEAGTHNMPGIAGLLAGIQFVQHVTPAAILQHERQLAAQAAQGLRELAGVVVFSEQGLAAQAGVVSFCVDGMDSETVGEHLGAAGFALRAGLHCAPYAHQTAGTLASGTVRASFSIFNTKEEVSAFLQAAGALVQSET